MKKENQLEKDIKKLKKRNRTLKAQRQHFYNSLHQFCRDVDYYIIDRNMTEKEAIRYVRYWYKSMDEEKEK
jgi:septal ring factor EnvC (AmiA/AmiB activator)